MSPESFIAKWSANTRPERAAAFEHFNDLCALLDEPTPNSDPTGADYAFEKGVAKSGQGRGFADVWKRGCFALEYKRKGSDLSAAFVQLQRYALALDNPPLLVVSDIDTVVIRTAWTNTVSETITIRLEEIADPLRRRVLKHMLSDPGQLRPSKTRQKLTEEAAQTFAKLAQRLRDRGHPAQAVAHFINRIVFCLFADHAGILPGGLLQKLLTASAKSPTRFEKFARYFSGALSSRDGDYDLTAMPWFNGWLFEDDAALPLRAEDLTLLQAVRTLDGADIDVSIFGTLFERGLDPDKRSQLGAHYTDRDKIMLIIDPVIVRPLRAEWADARERIEAALAAKAARTKALAAAQIIYESFVDRLAAFRVLDPACGSGNFLYLAVQALQDIEHLAGIEAEALGLQRAFARVGPEAVLGIEINPFAAELARVSVWIGHIQWARRNGVPPPSAPVLRTLDTIECRDAVLAPDGTPATWPAVDVIVGNPPFLGDKLMRGVLGDTDTLRLRNAYAGRVPGGADLVCYWFEQARLAISNRRASCAGLVATNSIRGGASRAVLEAIDRCAVIFEAWSDEPWTVEGAAVRVALICFAPHPVTRHLNGSPVTSIPPSLVTQSDNLAAAKRLQANLNVCFQGTIKVGPFDVSGAIARNWLSERPNANGRTNADVVRPWRNAMHVTRRIDDTWVIDFGAEMLEREASFYVAPFGYVLRQVKPIRDNNRDAQRRRDWWRFGRSHHDLRAALLPIPRYIATPAVAKHRMFVWLDSAVIPDHQLYAVARDDDTTFGVLHSRFHESWSLRLGTSLEDRPRYTPTTTFEIFPFPEGLTPDIPAAGYADDPHARAVATAARALVEMRDRWLNPEDLVDRVPDILPHLPHRTVPRDPAAALKLRSRTLTKLYNTRGTPEGAWLDALHADLDAAVAAAYGWPADISEADALARLLALNLSRAPLTRSTRGAGPGRPVAAKGNPN